MPPSSADWRSFITIPLLACAIFVLAHRCVPLFRTKNSARDESEDLAHLQETERSGRSQHARNPADRFAIAAGVGFQPGKILGETIAWAVPCISGRGRRIPANLFGALVATNEEPRKLFFVARKGGRAFARQSISRARSLRASRSFFLKTCHFSSCRERTKIFVHFPAVHARLGRSRSFDMSARRVAGRAASGLHREHSNDLDSETAAGNREIRNRPYEWRAETTMAILASLAERYAELARSTRVQERTLFPTPRIPTELELQARWFAGDFGRHFRSTSGDEIEIVQFGTWNREAGPDFREAAIRLNGGEPIRGSIEIRSDRSQLGNTRPRNESRIRRHGAARFRRRRATRIFHAHEIESQRAQVRVDPDDPAGCVFREHSAGATRPLSGAAQRFAGGTDPQRARRCGAIPTAAKGGADPTRSRKVMDATKRFFRRLATALGYKQNKLPSHCSRNGCR